jgi:hypothetical protein
VHYTHSAMPHTGRHPGNAGVSEGWKERRHREGGVGPRMLSSAGFARMNIGLLIPFVNPPARTRSVNNDSGH